MRYKFLILLLFIINLFAFGQQDLPNEKRSSFEGRHFYIGFMQNEIGIDALTGLELTIYISCRDYANIEVFIPNRAQPYNFYIAKDSVLTISVPEQVEVRRSEEPLKSLVEIKSDEPITVYSFNSQEMSSDSYSAIPVSLWGKEYVVISMPNDQYEIPDGTYDLSREDSLFYLSPRSSQFMIISAYDSTEIEFAPKALTMRGKQIGQLYRIILNKGECYLVKSLNTQRGTGDLTGTIVRSNKPIGLLSGHVRTSIPVGLPYPYDSKDHLVEMLLPTEAWGRNFITVPFGVNLEGDLFRITSIYDNTIVNFETQYEQRVINLSTPGSLAELRSVNDPAVWRANKPIQISQFMMHTGSAFDNPNFDPCMVIIPPLEQFVSRIIFQTPGNSPRNPDQYVAHYALVIVHKNALQTIKLDGKLLRNTTQIANNRIYGTDFHWARLEVNLGKHEIIADSGSFAGILYARGRADSYGMILGSSLTNPFKKDSLPPKLLVTEECGDIRGTIYEQIDANSSGIDFVQVIKDSTTNYTWEISKITDTSTVVTFKATVIDPFKDGKFVIEFRDKNGNGRRYTHIYKAIKIDYPSSLYIADTDVNSENCVDVVLRNNGQDTIIIESIGNSDKRLKITTKDKFPIKIAPGGRLNLSVCFKPEGNSEPLLDTVEINIGCDRFVRLPVNGKVIAAGLWTNNLDFGKVKVGETKCDTILIVNTGNIPLLIDKLIMEEQYKVFVVDTFYKLPHNLKPGDTLKLIACFSPDSTIVYITKANAKNNQNIQNVIEIKGRGIASLVNSVVIDWGKRRIGTTNDTSVVINNEGEAQANITYVRLDLSSHYENDPGRNKLIDWNVSIPPEDTVHFDVSFVPLDTLVYQNTGVYYVDCVKHPYINITLLGQGSIPIIQTDTIHLGTHIVGQRVDSVVSLIKSRGNEELTIDSIYILNGNTEQFLLDLSSLKSIKVDYNADLYSTVSYLPKSVGNHQIRLAVINDAEPNYNRRIDTVVILANAVPADTPDCELYVIAPETVYTCNTARYVFQLKNTGNVPLTIQTVEFSSSELTLLPESYTLPITFNPDETLNFYVDILSKIAREAKLKFVSIINDSIYREIEVTIVIQSLPQSIKVIPQIYALPGEHLYLELEGYIIKGSEFQHRITFEIEIPMQNFILTDESGFLELYTDEEIEKHLMTFYQTSNKIISQSVNYIKIDDNVLWKLKVPVSGLLSENRINRGYVKISIDECFETQHIVLNTEISEVCIHSSRIIKMIGNAPIFEITPIPADDIINLNIIMNNDDNLNIELYDYLGKILKNKNLYLKKGTYSFIFEVNNFSSGIYLLILRTTNYIENKTIIIKN